MKLHPTSLSMYLIGIPALLSIALVVDTAWLPMLLILDGAVLAILLLDVLIGLPHGQTFALQQRMRGTWSHNQFEEVHFDLDHFGRFGRTITVTPDVPRQFQVEDAMQELRVPGRRRAGFLFRIRSKQRGTFELGGLYLATRSRLGLWRRHWHLQENKTIHVYPNLRQLSDYAMLARTDRLSLIGVRAVRRIGGDTEFERLREYQSDDALNRIDWKASARRDELIVRDYQTSQSQSVIFMIDAGRMMVSRFSDAEGRDGGTLLDQAIDSALMLAYVAITQGDRVGMIVYADGIKRYVPPRGGPRQLNHLIHAVHDIEASLVESRHEEAFLYLQKKERKRSLAVLFTHVLDEVNVSLLKHHLQTVNKHHLPMAVLLRDQDLHRPLTVPPKKENEFWRAGAAAIIANWREEVLQSLARQGALVVDTDAEGLTAAVVSKYLEVKGRHLL